MPAAARPANEAERLVSLRSYEVLDTACEVAFDDIVSVAARLTGCPTALVSLTDESRQWFKARVGLDVSETHRDLAFCAHAILEPGQPLIVPDATRDPRFADNPFVTGDVGLRAYLGAPLVNPEGHALGTLCVLDYTPRTFDQGTVATVQSLARTVATTLELHRAMLRLRAMAMTDPLTGLPNRLAVDATLGDLLGEGRPAAVIAIDLDHLKEVNDSEGHAAGDMLLRAAAERLRASLRLGDLVGRVGGDEFIAVLGGVADRDLASAIAERVGAALNHPVKHGTRQLRLGATLGIAMAPADADEPGLLKRAADEALIRAKGERRGTLGWATRADVDRRARAGAILRAFDRSTRGDEVVGARVHLQPILTLANGEGGQVLAVEALARYQHPSLGAVPPEELLRVIGPERTARLGRAVRAQALAALAVLRRTGLARARVALNLSAGEVMLPEIGQVIAEEVARAGLPLSAVEVEITEEVLLDRVSDRTLDGLASLRDQGARLALDDFGTGNAGLAQLLRLSLDAVKLDKCFVQRLGVDARAEEIVRATISLAHSLGMSVVGEGVETEQQAGMLRTLGCDAVQGFLFARPMDLAVLEEWLQKRASGDPGLI